MHCIPYFYISYIPQNSSITSSDGLSVKLETITNAINDNVNAGTMACKPNGLGKK